MNKEKYSRFLVIGTFSVIILSFCYSFFKKFYLFKTCSRYTVGTVVKNVRDYGGSTFTLILSIKYKKTEYLIDGSNGKSYPNGTKFLVKFSCEDPYINETYTKVRIQKDFTDIPDEGWKDKPYYLSEPH